MNIPNTSQAKKKNTINDYTQKEALEAAYTSKRISEGEDLPKTG